METILELNAALRALTLVLALVGGAGNLAAGLWLICKKKSVRRGLAHLTMVVVMAVVLEIITW